MLLMFFGGSLLCLLRKYADGKMEWTEIEDLKKLVDPQWRLELDTSPMEFQVVRRVSGRVALRFKRTHHAFQSIFQEVKRLPFASNILPNVTKYPGFQGFFSSKKRRLTLSEKDPGAEQCFGGRASKAAGCTAADGGR